MTIIRTRKYSLIPSIGIGGLGILLIVLGLVPFWVRVMTAPQEEVRSRFLQGESVSQKELIHFVEGRERFLTLLPLNSFYNDLVQIVLHLSAGRQQKASLLLTQAETWQKKALSLSPSDPYGWFRLAYLWDRLYGEKKAARAFLKSYQTAPYEPRLLLARLGMARKVRPFLGGAESLIKKLIRQAWAYNPWHLARKARDEKFLDEVRLAFKEDEKVLKRLDKILKEQLF